MAKDRVLPTPARPPPSMVPSAPPAPISAFAAAAAPVPIIPSHAPNQKASSAATPEFGQPSPMRNPLKANNSIFMPKPKSAQRPAQAHRSVQPRAPADIDLTRGPVESSRPTSTASLGTRDAPINLASPAARSGFRLPGQKRHDIQQSYVGGTLQAEFFEVTKPTNPVLKTIPAAARPTFSTLGPNVKLNEFPTASRNNFIDLTNGDHGFDPDAALRQNKFGLGDIHEYVDPSKASENIKALLEGAFDDDDDDQPKLRLPKRRSARKQPATVIATDTSSLTEKLSKMAVVESSEIKEANGPAQDEDEEEEDGIVEGLVVTLLPHQVEGVAWMIDKENGLRKKNGVIPKGGILADDMGLGKTVQSITLMLSNPRPPVDQQPENNKTRLPGKDVGKGTLVVAPLALIKQWEAEIKTKVEKSHAMKVLVHHGPNRAKSYLELKKYDVVITTYQILASEHAASNPKPDGLKVGCFGVSWYRVILDEAHSIKNKSAKSTQACCALESWFRWCLTGTPMQNNLDELQSLINFLRIKPYDDLKQWRAQITQPMKNGRGNHAMKRVQYFLKAFMKRRTKDILKKEGALNFGKQPKNGNQPQKMNIVARNIETIVCELDGAEREFYDKLSERANNRLQDMMSGAKQDYIGALVLLLRLRQACNHPALIQSAMAKDKDALATAGLGSQSPTKKSSSMADADLDGLADMLGGLGMTTKNCDVCQTLLKQEQLSAGKVRCTDCDDDLRQQKRAKKLKAKEQHAERVRTAAARQRAKSRRILADDSDDEEGDGDWLVPEHERTDLGRSQLGGADDEDAEGTGITLESEDSSVTSDTPARRNNRSKVRRSSTIELDSDASSVTSSDNDAPSSTRASTKIQRLVKILQSEAPQHKVIVFSQFTTMLDLIEPHLNRHSIRFTRYDGSMRNDAREASLASLRDNSTTRVLLCSLKCGALGLNLTAASRVVIVEPFWNPFVEEQAIDRVHRLNQTVDVKVYKLTVANTVEEKIIALQEKKRELANAAIEGGKAVAKLSMRDLLSLFGGNGDGPTDHEVRNGWRPPSGGGASGGLLERQAGSGTVTDVGTKSHSHRGTIAAPAVVPERRRLVSGGRPRAPEDPIYGRR